MRLAARPSRQGTLRGASVSLTPVSWSHIVAVFTVALAALAVGHTAIQRPAAALALALAVPVLVWAASSPGIGLSAAIAVAVAVPTSAGHVWLTPPMLAATGLFAARRLSRWTFTDLAFTAWALWVTLSWWRHSELLIDRKAFFVTGLAPLLFYVWARLSVNERTIRRVLWTLLAAGTIGASTVLYELALGHVVFNDGANYQWAGGNGQLFRPGGVFGGSPAAAISLTMISLATLSLVRDRRRLALSCQAIMLIAIVATYSRAGWVGLLVGIVVVAVMLPYRRWGVILYLVGALALIGYTMKAAFIHTQTYQAGVIRSQNTSTRELFLKVALPLSTDSPEHFLVGRGYKAFQSPTGEHDARFREIDPQLWLVQGGPHNDYMRALLEQGLIGLLLMVAWVFTGLRRGLRARQESAAGSDERLMLAGLTGAVASFAAASVFHDLSHSIPSVTVAALMLGVLVTVASRARE